MYHVYILQSQKDNKLYIGFTSVHPAKRLKEHNCGDTTSTKPKRLFKLVYYEVHLSEKDARRKEKYFKTQKGKSTLKQVLRDGLKTDI